LLRIEAFGFRAVQLSQEEIEPLLHAFAFALFLVQRFDELANHRVAQRQIVWQRWGVNRRSGTLRVHVRRNAQRPET
jgi:hypothetical protein